MFGLFFQLGEDCEDLRLEGRGGEVEVQEVFGLGDVFGRVLCFEILEVFGENVYCPNGGNRGQLPSRRLVLFMEEGMQGAESFCDKLSLYKRVSQFLYFPVECMDFLEDLLVGAHHLLPDLLDLVLETFQEADHFNLLVCKVLFVAILVA